MKTDENTHKQNKVINFIAYLIIHGNPKVIKYLDTIFTKKQAICNWEKIERYLTNQSYSFAQKNLNFERNIKINYHKSNCNK